MSNSVTTRELLLDGWTHQSIRRAVGAGELTRLRRGAYFDGSPEYTDRIEAAVAACRDDVVVSHASAAHLLDLPVQHSSLSTVHLTRSKSYGGDLAADVHFYPCPFGEADIMELDGIRMTTPARTVVDLGRHEPLPWSVAAGDAALRFGLTQDALHSQLASSRRRPGMVRARRAVSLLNPLAESPGESISRVNMMLAGLPRPQLQAWVPCGDTWARVDFLWPEWGLVGEFDGAVKYARLLRSGQEPADAVTSEKWREDGIRGHGIAMVRWDWQVAHDARALNKLVRRGAEVAKRSGATELAGSGYFRSGAIRPEPHDFGGAISRPRNRYWHFDLPRDGGLM